MTEFGTTYAALSEPPFVATPPPGVVRIDRMLALTSTSTFGIL